MRKLPYKEGDWFAVPLKKGGWAVGRVALMTKGGILGYFFGPRMPELPTLNDLKDYLPEGSIAIYRFGDLGLLKGEWPVLGQEGEWRRENWPMPSFSRKDPLVENTYREIFYSENNIFEEIYEQFVPFERAKVLPEDTLHGHGSVEISLDRLLA